VPADPTWCQRCGWVLSGRTRRCLVVIGRNDARLESWRASPSRAAGTGRTKGRWRRTGRGGQRRPRPAPTAPRRRSPAQLRPAHRRAHPGPDAHQRRSCLLRPQDRRGRDPQRGHESPQTPTRRPRLANHDHRRACTAPGGELGRTLGGDSAVQRGRSNPDNQLFGQVTSRARRDPPYDLRTCRLTDTEEPRRVRRLDLVRRWSHDSSCPALPALRS